MSAARITLSVSTLALLGALPMPRRRRRARTVRPKGAEHPVLVLERALATWRRR